MKPPQQNQSLSRIGVCLKVAYRRAKKEVRISATTSTGLALGLSRTQCQLVGLLETIERDAFALAWNFSMPCEKIEISSAQYRHLQRDFDFPEASELSIYQVSHFPDVSVVIVFLEFQKEGFRYLCVGSAARMEFLQAFRKALLEAVQGVPYVQFLRDRYRGDLEDDFTQITSFEKSAVFYSLYPHHVNLHGASPVVFK